MIPDEAIEAWGLANDEGVYVMSEAHAREALNDDMTLMRKVGGEWEEADA